MTLQRIVLLPILFLFFGTLQAQYMPDSIPVKPLKHAIGAALGLTTGYGLSYRFMPKRFGVQVAFAPTHSEYQTNISAGLTLLYTLEKTKHVNLFLYQGNHLLYRKYQYYYPFPGEFDETTFYNGLGFGFEFLFLKRMSFNLMGGYAGYENFNSLGFTGETSLFFRF